MASWLYTHRTVIGAPERLGDALRSDLRGLLRRATGSEDAAVGVDGSFTVRLDRNLTGSAVAKTVRMATGVATVLDEVEQRLHIPLVWEARPGRYAFPTFDGAIELVPLSGHAADLVLIGTYQPPLGPLGEIADAVALYRVAQTTGERLLAALARNLEEAVRRGEPAEADVVASPTGPLRVEALMTPDPMILTADMPVRTAALLLRHHGVHGAPVTDPHGALIGVLSEADLLEKEAAPRYGLGKAVDRSWQRREATTVGEACSKPARVTVPQATVHEAAREMLNARVARLVVIDDCRIAGIITRSDVLTALLRSDSALQAAVDLLLRDLDEPEIEAEVEWGKVQLRGRARLRSGIAAVVERVRGIDGVMAVDEELGWQEDDISTLPPVAI